VRAFLLLFVLSLYRICFLSSLLRPVSFIPSGSYITLLSLLQGPQRRLLGFRARSWRRRDWRCHAARASDQWSRLLSVRVKGIGASAYEAQGMRVRAVCTLKVVLLYWSSRDRAITNGRSVATCVPSWWKQFSYPLLLLRKFSQRLIR